MKDLCEGYTAHCMPVQLNCYHDCPPPLITNQTPPPLPLIAPVVSLLGRFIAVKDANIRYLGLEAMTRLARSDGPKKAQVCAPVCEFVKGCVV